MTDTFNAAELAYLTPPDEPPRDYRCCTCGDMFYDGELTTYPNGDGVCESCKTDYLRRQGADLHTEFMLQHIPDAGKTWFYQYLKPCERDSIIFATFVAAMSSNSTNIAEFKTDYCHDSDGFLEFVENKLINEVGDYE